MVRLSMVGEGQAAVGKRFVFLGPVMECEQCAYRSVCLRLDEGAEYEVTKVRNTAHPCDATEGIAVVVEVEKVPRDMVVDKKLALEGSTITFAPSGCGNVGCEHYLGCNPVGMADGIKLSVESVGKKIDCSIGESRVSVKAIRSLPKARGVSSDAPLRPAVIAGVPGAVGDPPLAVCGTGSETRHGSQPDLSKWVSTFCPADHIIAGAIGIDVRLRGTMGAVRRATPPLACAIPLGVGCPSISGSMPQESASIPSASPALLTRSLITQSAAGLRHMLPQQRRRMRLKRSASPVFAGQELHRFSPVMRSYMST